MPSGPTVPSRATGARAKLAFGSKSTTVVRLKAQAN
jgi:hypothetical protein